MTKNDDEALPGKTLLAHDLPESVAPYIADLLDDAGIRVLVYAGDRDLTTNMQGSEIVLDGMEWSGNRESNSKWKTADRYLWMVDGNVAGYAKTTRNLSMLLVLNSGHLVPYNVPVNALDLITRLTSDMPFDDIILPRVSVPESMVAAAYSSSNGTSKLHKIFHAFLLLCVAVVCFFSGVLTGTRFVQSRSPAPYQEVPEASNGAHLLIDQAITPIQSKRPYKD